MGGEYIPGGSNQSSNQSSNQRQQTETIDSIETKPFETKPFDEVDEGESEKNLCELMNTQKTYYTVPSGLSNVCMEPDSEALPPAKKPKRGNAKGYNNCYYLKQQSKLLLLIFFGWQCPREMSVKSEKGQCY